MSDNSSNGDGSVDMEPPSHSKLAQFLREWRQEALNKAQYESAISVGDKLLALTHDDDDVFWLAQVYFAMGNYKRALSYLKRRDLIHRNPSCRYLAGHCLVKQSRYDEALAVLGERNPTYLIKSKDANKRKIQPIAGGQRKSGPSKAKTLDDDSETEEEAANRRYQAGMCYLRGLCFAKQNAFDRAKEAYKDAVRIDVQCLEAFTQLTKNQLLAPEEEWEFLQSLDFDSIKVGGKADQEVADYVQWLYSSRLSKYQNRDAIATACDTLATHYGLKDNPDILLARADIFFTQCRFRQALEVTNAVLAQDKYNFNIYPIHLACLYELKEKNQLFLISHELAESHPEEPCTWLAVATYYFLIDKIAEARRYFSKASMMNPHFAAAWIGFAHTFAAEGEHDQAISAYSTAARLFMGSHLPQVFLGMQHHAMNNMTVAEELLKTAYGMCKNDPLLLNEMGIVYYHQDRPKDAITMFRKALEVIEDTEADAEAWLRPRINLGYAYRRLRMHEKALGEFDLALRDGGRDVAVFCAKGLIYLELRRPEDAVEVLHDALAINAQDPTATELLNKALEESAASIAPGLDEGADLGGPEAKTRPPGRGGGSSHRDRAKGKGKEGAGTGREKGEGVMETTDED
ncbi:Anaphase-promoting complex subunit cut9 [Pleurostoma richardsiae]|uniref:Anaphase-promoting complex subunit cut9 n=1 Tax=Pleurostoma richardsiae TaxID=41990 RepID=A0AA38VCY3_9PEZI|nr:Anaphase-promoting complex subunit cut9 [Pleurostoma richardsiae]